MSTVRTTVRCVSALGSALVLVASCKRSPAPPPEPVASALPSVSSAPAAEPLPPARCRPLTEAGLAATLGDRTPKEGDGGVDDDVALPFSPEIGAGVPFGAGFVLSASLPHKGGNTAAAVLLSPRLPSSRTVDLGRIHGDVSPPRLAATKDALFAVVNDGAPHGTLARLARIDDLEGTPRVSWGAEVEQGADDSEVIALEAGAAAVVLAWDEWDAHGEKGVVKIVSAPPTDLKHVSSPIVVPTEDDAEGPILVRRAGGFWAAFLGRSARADAPKADKRAPAADPAEPAETPPTWIVVLPLDDSGKPAGAPRRVTPKEGHAQGFDLATLPGGDALVAYRDDKSVPGTSGGVVRLVTVHASGSTDVRTLADDDLGPGVPTLIPDGDATKPTWLAFPNDTGVARLVALDADGRSLDSLSPEAPVGTATLLAAHGGRLLGTRPHGQGVEAVVLTCEKGAPPTTAAPAPAPSASAP